MSANFLPFGDKSTAASAAGGSHGVSTPSNTAGDSIAPCSARPTFSYSSGAFRPAMNTRRRALQYATRSGVPVSDMVRLYDTTTDPQMKEALINVYGQSGERIAVDKLMAIAKGEENQGLRRRTISSLSRSEDPRVKEFLRDLVEK